MIVRRFLLWARTVSPLVRADGVRSLARAYILHHLCGEDRTEAETALTAMLDDPSPDVRRAMAEAFLEASNAPRHLIVALANDQSDIAALVLARSPVLTDADLVDCAAMGDDLMQTAVALRPHVSASVAAALAEVGSLDAVTTLCHNRAADLPDFSLMRIIERFGAEGDVREAMMERPHLPIIVRQELAVAAAKALAAFVNNCGWLSLERGERASREAREKATLSLSMQADSRDVVRLAAHVRRSGHLTPALLLRAVLSNATGFVEAAFSELTGVPIQRVSGLLYDRRTASFSALYRKAGLPEHLRPAFEAALAVGHEQGADLFEDEARLCRRRIERALTASAMLDAEEASRLMALLRRFEVEAARDEARTMADALADDAALALVLEHEPNMLLEDDSEVEYTHAPLAA
jgi:uncharacterized protein (DUF2336 family)